MNENFFQGSITAFLQSYSTVFWDFDGVIKNSVAVKSSAYVEVFSSFGSDVTGWVKDHHELNGGMSRFEKIPLYLEKAGIQVSDSSVTNFCNKFSDIVVQQVIESPWVAGVAEYLQAQHACKAFVLVTATPEAEIEFILDCLQIKNFFRRIYGAPTSKSVAIRDAMDEFSVAPAEAIMIGDAKSDMTAARENGVAFLLRRTCFNTDLQSSYSGPQFKDFVDG